MPVYILYCQAELEGVQRLSLSKDATFCFSVRNTHDAAEVREKIVVETDVLHKAAVGKHDKHREEAPHHFGLKWNNGDATRATLQILGADSRLVEDTNEHNDKSVQKTNNKKKGHHQQSVQDKALAMLRDMTAEDSGRTFVPMLAMECHGMEPIAFHPMGEEEFAVVGANTGKVYDNVDLADGDWSEYDLSTGSVSVTNLAVCFSDADASQEDLQAGAVTVASLNQTRSSSSPSKKEVQQLPPACEVIFVVGAPGTGKGTQCQLLVEKTKGAWVHLSAGDLLRAERQRVTDGKNSNGNDDGDDDLELAHTIQNCINAGKLVPSSITVRLLEKGMKQAYQKTGCTKFLLDGFPRGQDNIDAWDNQMAQHNVSKVLNYECPEEALVERLLERGKSSGRSDDNIETIKKRFQTHVEACKPVLERYEKDGILHTISSDQSVEEVYKQTEKIVLGK